MPAEQKNIKVAVRMRPYNRKELEQNQRCVIKVLDEKTLLFDPDEEDEDFFYQGTKQNYRDLTKKVNKKLSMDFDRVYDTDATNQQIFEDCTAPLVDTVLNGYNCSVFVYGATGAGKTFTMLGGEKVPGLTYLTMQDLFNKIEIQSDKRKFDVGVSYLEVYNENVMNLLTKNGPLKLLEDSNGVVVSGLVLKPIFSADELLRLLALGNSNRTQHPTDANAESSRSHAVFQVHIRITDRKTGTKRTVKLSMIDLAGSERAASTKGIGVRFKEGASINKSLLALGNCINKLADGLKHIPYRDSNLTRLLKDSLGGNCQTLMVANVSMSSLTYEDTYNTLKYASRAKKIRTTLKQNVLTSNMPKDYYIKKVTELMAENEKLREANKAFESHVESMQKPRVVAMPAAYDENELEVWYNKINDACLSVIRSQENMLDVQSRMKALEFRLKMKSDSDELRVALGKSTSEDDITRDSATRYQYETYMQSLDDEFKRWRDHFFMYIRNLLKIKKECKNTKYAYILQIFFKHQNLKIENSKLKYHTDHYKRLNIEMITDLMKLNKVLTIGCKLINNFYGNTSTNRELSADTQANLQQFRTVIKSKSTTLLDDIQSASARTEVLFEGKHNLFNKDDCPTTSAAKRPRIAIENFDIDIDVGHDILEESDEDNECDSTKSIIKELETISENPNETRVIHTASEVDINVQNKTVTKGRVVSNYKSNPIAKKNLVTNILSEKIVQVAQNKEHVKNVLLKSKTFTHQGFLKTVTGTLKENKRFSPNRVRKSPRTVVSKAVMSTANFVKKQPARFVSGSTEPTVRINRAASFRVKKQ